MSSVSVDEMEATQDYFEALEYGRGGGSRKKKKNRKNREPDSKTSKEARNEALRNAIEERVTKSKARLSKIIKSRFSKDFKENMDVAKNDLLVYSKWVSNSLNGLVLDWNNGVEEEDVKKSSGPGGQNVNKVSSGIRLTHVISGITVGSFDSRDQPENRKIAGEGLYKRLESHVSDWKTIYTHMFEGSTLDKKSDFSNVVEDMCLDILGLGEKEKEDSLDSFN